MANVNLDIVEDTNEDDFESQDDQLNNVIPHQNYQLSNKDQNNKLM